MRSVLMAGVAWFALAGCSEAELTARPHRPDAGEIDASEAGAAVDVGVPTIDGTPGLELLGATMIPWDESGSPHATRMLLDGDRTLVLDTNLVIGGPRTDKGWDLSLRSEPAKFLRCTVGTLSRTTNSVYCASPDTPAIVVFDSRDGRKKFPAEPLGTGIARGIFDLSVTSSALYAATAGIGLERIPLDAAGIPDLTARTVVLAGDIQALDGDGARRLVAADARSRTLFFLEDEKVVRWVGLDGPPSRVRIEGDEVQVAMGGRGAAVIDWNTGAVRHRVAPLAAVNGTAKRGDLLALATLTGLYVYNLARSAEVPIGFIPAEYGFLDAAFVGDELHAIDWRLIHAYRVRPEGHVARVDAPLGYVIRKGEGVRFPLRNEGDLPITAAGTRVAPRSIGWIEVPPGEKDSSVLLDVGASGDRRVHIARRDDRVGLGQPLGFREPFLNGRAVFALPDCALQFVEWKDVRYLNELGYKPRSTLISVFESEHTAASWAEIWSIDGLPISSFIDGGNEDLFNSRYGMTLMFGGADVEVSFDTDDKGDVVNHTHQYRSNHVLPPPQLLR